MKIYLSALVIGGCLFFSTESSAQMGYGRPGTNPGRMDRSIGMNQYSNGKQKKNVSKENMIDDALNYLEKELNLDSFQKAVIKDLLVSNQAEETKILADDIPEDLKFQKIAVLREKLDEKIKPVLSTDQIALFVKMKDRNKS